MSNAKETAENITKVVDRLADEIADRCVETFKSKSGSVGPAGPVVKYHARVVLLDYLLGDLDLTPKDSPDKVQ